MRLHLEASTTPRTEVLRRIEAHLVGYVESLLSGKDPCIRFHDSAEDLGSAKACRVAELTTKRGA